MSKPLWIFAGSFAYKIALIPGAKEITVQRFEVDNDGNVCEALGQVHSYSSEKGVIFGRSVNAVDCPTYSLPGDIHLAPQHFCLGTVLDRGTENVWSIVNMSPNDQVSMMRARMDKWPLRAIGNCIYSAT